MDHVLMVALRMQSYSCRVLRRSMRSRGETGEEIVLWEHVEAAAMKKYVD
jgi:hypothetical protein